jgi:hypothetical protein
MQQEPPCRAFLRDRRTPAHGRPERSPWLLTPGGPECVCLLGHDDRQDRRAVGSVLGSIHSSSGAAATRKPRLLLRLPGSFLLRFAVRQFVAELFQLPPRFTRLEPWDRPPAIVVTHPAENASSAARVSA